MYVKIIPWHKFNSSKQKLIRFVQRQCCLKFEPKLFSIQMLLHDLFTFLIDININYTNKIVLIL